MSHFRIYESSDNPDPGRIHQFKEELDEMFASLEAMKGPYYKRLILDVFSMYGYIGLNQFIISALIEQLKNDLPGSVSSVMVVSSGVGAAMLDSTIENYSILIHATRDGDFSSTALDKTANEMRRDLQMLVKKQEEYNFTEKGRGQ